jgi:hypothetical protein
MILLERMSDGHIELLIKAQNEFPLTMKPVMEELNGMEYWTALSYQTVSVLVEKLNLKGYNPSYVSELFKN